MIILNIYEFMFNGIHESLNNSHILIDVEFSDIFNYVIDNYPNELLNLSFGYHFNQ